MVRALTKRKQNGVLYTRRPDIEFCLENVTRLAPATVRERAGVMDESDPEFLPSEVLLHLIRNALRSQDHSTANALIGILGRRCLDNLVRHLRPSRRFDAEALREDILRKLYELIADEVGDPEKNELDYYEVQFNSAFATLRVGFLRAAYRHNAHFADPPPTANESEDGVEAVDAADQADELPETDLQLQADAYDLLCRIQALPPEECEAATWKYFGYKTESTDPNETTVASLCGVSGRVIRARLHSAKSRLKKMEDEL